MFAARSSRSSAIRVLFLALVLALLVSARAAEDHDDHDHDDHDDHDHDDHGDEEPVDFACTAPCGAADAAVRTRRTTSLLPPARGNVTRLRLSRPNAGAPGASHTLDASSAGGSPAGVCRERRVPDRRPSSARTPPPFSRTQHPCGADEYVASDEYSTCNLTLANIMNVSAYATATHVVPCPSDVCEEKCTAEGATSDGLFNCFNTSITTDATAAEANHRALAMGCVGNHAMNMSGTTKYMVGAEHGTCEAGYVHFHDDDHDDDHDDHSAAARATFAAALVVALALFSAAA